MLPPGRLALLTLALLLLVGLLHPGAPADAGLVAHSVGTVTAVP